MHRVHSVREWGREGAGCLSDVNRSSVEDGSESLGVQVREKQRKKREEEETEVVWWRVPGVRLGGLETVRQVEE